MIVNCDALSLPQAPKPGTDLLPTLNHHETTSQIAGTTFKGRTQVKSKVRVVIHMRNYALTRWSTGPVRSGEPFERLHEFHPGHETRDSLLFSTDSEFLSRIPRNPFDTTNQVSEHSHPRPDDAELQLCADILRY